jgi:hypothetical protein
MAFGVRILTAVALSATLLSGPAFAQVSTSAGAPQKEKSPLALEADERQKRREQIDKEYNAALLRSLGDSKAVKTDPWANMRAPDDGQKR